MENHTPSKRREDSSSSESDTSRQRTQFIVMAPSAEGALVTEEGQQTPMLTVEQMEVLRTKVTNLRVKENLTEAERTFLQSDTRLASGEPAVLVDPGSRGNLCGDVWAREASVAAIKAGLQPSQQQRAQPLEVMGVGNGSQKCHTNITIPVAMTKTDGKATVGSFSTPVVGNGKGESDLPALLGLASMNGRSILDMRNHVLHFLGPGDVTIELPPGSSSYQLTMSHSGHLMLPCSRFETHPQRPVSGGLTLSTEDQLHLMVGEPPAPEGSQATSADQSSSQ